MEKQATQGPDGLRPGVGGKRTGLHRGERQPDSPQLFTKHFDVLVRKTGLPRIRLHDLRHTHAALALQAGIHPRTVSERLGDATVAFTLDSYSHTIPAFEEAAAERIAKLVFDA